MALYDAIERKANFTFIWATESASALLVGKCSHSPVFTVKAMEMTKWNLRMDYSSIDSNVSVSIIRKAEEEGPKSIKIYFELSFLGADGLPLIAKTGSKVFSSDSFCFLELSTQNDIFYRRKNEFLPKDVLTVRCRMWRMGIEHISDPDICFARTRMGRDRYFSVWAIKDFDSLQPGQKRSRLLKTKSEASPELIMTFCFAEFFEKEYICIEIISGFAERRFGIAGEIALLDVKGAVVHSTKVDVVFVQPCGSVSTLNDFFEKQKLLSNKSTISPNGVLFLRCEMEVFYDAVCSEIEYCGGITSSDNTGCE